jgi:hypothetical protein
LPADDGRDRQRLLPAHTGFPQLHQIGLGIARRQLIDSNRMNRLRDGLVLVVLGHEDEYRLLGDRNGHFAVGDIELRSIAPLHPILKRHKSFALGSACLNRKNGISAI